MVWCPYVNVCERAWVAGEVTSMRMELLGTAFTAQHSDARVRHTQATPHETNVAWVHASSDADRGWFAASQVLDQLVYKWAHSRAVITEVLQRHVQLLAETGWPVTRAEVQRTAQRLLGGSYEEFLAK